MTRKPTSRARTIEHDPAEKAFSIPPARTSEGGDDVAMPTVENESPYVFDPKKGIGTIDMMEILLLFYLDLSGNTLILPKGTLRSIGISAARVETLSDQARQHMRQLEITTGADSPPVGGEAEA